MKIKVKKRNEQPAKVTINTKKCCYPYNIRNVIQLALELDGYTKEFINEVFGIMHNDKCDKKSPKEIYLDLCNKYIDTIDRLNIVEMAMIEYAQQQINML